MSDYVEDALLSLLNQARSNEEIAAHHEDLATAEHSKRKRDVSHLEGLLAHHLRQVAAEPPTQAIPAVPPVAPVNPLTATRAWCKNCGNPIVRSTPAHDWCHTSGLGLSPCYPDAIVSTEAEPALIPPPVVAPVAQGVAEATPEITRPDETPDGADHA